MAEHDDEPDNEAPADVYVIPDSRMYAPVSPAPASSPPPAVPGPTLMEQREENRKRWDAARDRWQPGDPTDDIERFGRIDLDFKSRLEALREGTPADPQQIASGLTAAEAQIPGSFAAQLEAGGLKPTTPEEVTFAKEFETTMPKQMAMPVELAIRAWRGLARTAGFEPKSERDGRLAVDVDIWAAGDALLAQVPSARAVLAKVGLLYEPTVREDLARLADTWRQTDHGTDWTGRGGSYTLRDLEVKAATAFDLAYRAAGYVD